MWLSCPLRFCISHKLSSFAVFHCYQVSDPLVPIYVKHVGVICQLSLNAPSHIYY